MTTPSERREVQFVIERLCPHFYSDPRYQEIYGPRMPFAVWVFWPAVTGLGQVCDAANAHYELTEQGKSDAVAGFGVHPTNENSRVTVCEHMGRVIE